MSEQNSAGTYDEGPSLALGDYVDIVRRNLWFLVVPAVVVALLGFVVVRSLPTLYTSTAKILVESQQIPEDLVRSTVTSYVDERIEFIRQKVLTRANILDVIEEYDLYRDSQQSRSELVRRFEEAITIERMSADAGRSRVTIAFNLSFLHEQPRTAQLVANELATLFLSENAATRTARAAETTAFLRAEADNIQREIRAAEARISEFKRENREQLPELFDVNMGRLERLEREFQQTSLSLTGLERELRFLYAQAQGTTPVSTTDVPGAEASLPELRARLDQLLLDFTATHPDVRRLQRLIDQREAELQDLDTPEEDAAPDPGLARAAMETAGGDVDLELRLPASVPASLAREIESVREQILYLRRSRAAMQEEIADLEDRLNQAPAIEQEWQDLQRGLSNLTAKYEELRAKELEARMAQSLEEEQKGERFVLLEPPVVPTEPSEPDLMKLYALVLAAAGAAGGGLMILMELLSPGLRGDGVIAHHLGAVPLAAIPYIATPGEVARRRHRWRALLVGTLAAALLAAALVHWAIMPLDVIYYLLLRRIGLD